MTSAEDSRYPAHREVDVVLRDGSTVRVRPVLLRDAEGVEALFDELSDESRRFRFHGLRRLSKAEIGLFVDVDYRDRFGLIAATISGNEPRIIALASYVRSGIDRAEIAITVGDGYHGLGVGSILIEHLSEAAREAGIEVFEAEVMSGNAGMLDVLRNLQLPTETRASSGVVHVEFPTAPTNEAVEAFELREAVAAAAGVARFMNPRSVAVIGASRNVASIGGQVFRSLLSAGFEGPVYPINPKGDVVQSVAAYRSVVDVPGPVDLAVIVVPASAVIKVARECAKKDVKALLVISAGFAEIGPEGRAMQDQLVEVARDHGMRMIGPNCMGILNTDPQVRLNATFSPIFPSDGRLAFSSQSGALGIAVMQRAGELGLGMSGFVSVGNKADISGNDLLQYWERDDRTDVILLYLESFGNPRKFARIARRVSREKPIVAVKSGRTSAGARAAASHTASVAAGDVAVEALFRQAGVIRTATLEQLFDVASLLAHQPLPQGDRVAILTNAGGLGILCADACEAAGLDVRELSATTRSDLEALLPVEASVGNPVDMIASATAEHYGSALEILGNDPEVDSIIVIFIPPLVTRAEDVADALAERCTRLRHKTVLACFMGVHGIHARLRSGDVVIPSHAFPESAGAALGRVANYAAWRRKPLGTVPTFPDIDEVGVQGYAAELLREGERWLEPQHVTNLLRHYGIRSAESRLTISTEDVAKAAAELGSPVAVKLVSKTIVHKTDVGGVQLNLTSPEEAEAAAERIVATLDERGLADQLDGFLVQEMVEAGLAEMFVGVTHDPSFGPLLACGAGGTLVELLRDVSVRITPLTDLDADEMVHSLRTYPLLEGFRGSPRLDIEAFEELLLRMSTMVEDLPAIAEVDLNPVLLFGKGRDCVVVDARMRLTVPEPAHPRGARTPSISA